MRISGMLRMSGGATAPGALLVGKLPGPGGSLGSLYQSTEAMAPLPANPPIGGPLWTVLIPALLLLGSFLGTYLLYRRFSGEEDSQDTPAG
jgi:hypothetical protein